jgi:alkanesulfonate monooxygenase SsuD/methylene tetrahydromethanopterin reductase-like flavin-dependent oxidoreductase (luciferase family)
VPTIAKAAADAGRPEPRVIACEGVDSIVELAAIGSKESIARQLISYLDAGAAELTLSPLDRTDSADHEALWRLAPAL